MAYRLRYLSRSAVRLKASDMAVTLINRALATHWQILVEEPRRTLRTLVAAYLLRLLPQSLYSQLEGVAAKAAGATQKQQILQERQVEQSIQS
jgi:hypothetical protein